MAFAHLWHKRNLPGKKVGFVFGLLLLVNSAALAQTVLRENYTKYDQKRLRFGFFLALNQARYKVQHSQALVEQQTGTGTYGSPNVQVNPFPSMNFSLGFISNVKLHDYFDLRFTPGVGFYRRGIEFKGDSVLGRRIKGGLEEKVVESAMIELPLLLKYKSKRRKNVRMYFVGGFKYSIDVTNKKDEQVDPELILRGASRDFSLEYGFGADLYYPFFKFGPELRFSHGMNNMRQDDPSAYARSLKRMSTHTITLLLQFE